MNILKLQQDVLDIQDRLTRELQFNADGERELLKTTELLGETLVHLQEQIRTMFRDRSVTLRTALGEPSNATVIGVTAITNGD